MKKELIEKKQNLENELLKINSQINLEILREDLEELQKITDQLNTLFQNRVVEKYGECYWRDLTTNASDSIYNAMQILDKASVNLEEEVTQIDLEINSKTEEN